MKRFLGLSMFAALALTSTAAFAADDCAKITATGHPQYPVIAYQQGDHLVGAAPMLVEAIAKKLNIPLESNFMGNWADAQGAARDGKADMIYGIYYNDERAKYLDYVQPAFIYDDVAIFVAKGKAFPFKGQDDLIGKKGVTNQGESYGTEFDAFIKDKLDVARADGIDAAFKELLDGKADYLIAGYYPGHRRSRQGRGERPDRGAGPGAAHRRDVRRLLQEVALHRAGCQVWPGHYRDDDRRQLRRDPSQSHHRVGRRASQALRRLRSHRRSPPQRALRAAPNSSAEHSAAAQVGSSHPKLWSRALLARDNDKRRTVR